MVVGQHHIDADGVVHDELGGDEGVGGGCGQAANEGGEVCPWVCGQDGVRKGSVGTYLIMDYIILLFQWISLQVVQLLILQMAFRI
jgi:hypothetical protein